MKSATLRAVPTVAPVKAPRARRAKAPRTPVAVLAKCAGGMALGAFVPFAAHAMSHEAPGALGQSVTAACLVYSAPTVCGWARSEFCGTDKIGTVKALGFVFCLEAIMVAAPSNLSWLSWIAMSLLMMINATVLAAKGLKRA